MNGKIFNEDNVRLAFFFLAIWGLLWNFSSGINQRIDRLEDNIGRKLERIDTRLDSFGERIAANEARLNAKE